MSSKRHLCFLTTFFVVAACSKPAVCQVVTNENQRIHCQGQTCATITGTIDDRKLPPRKDRPFLITLYPAPYGESVAAIAAGAGQTFTLPPQKPGSYVISVSGYTSECWIQWRKRVKLRAGETKTINPKPRVVPVSGCE